MFLTLRHRWRWHERVEHISWSDCNHVCTTSYIISASDLAFCSLAIPRGRLPICIFRLQFIGLIWEIAARWATNSELYWGTSTNCSTPTPIPSAMENLDSVDLQVIEARRPLVRLRQRSIGQEMCRQRWPFPPRTFVPGITGILRKTTTGILTDTTRKHFFIGFQFPT